VALNHLGASGLPLVSATVAIAAIVSHLVSTHAGKPRAAACPAI